MRGKKFKTLLVAAVALSTVLTSFAGCSKEPAESSTPLVSSEEATATTAPGKKTKLSVMMVSENATKIFLDDLKIPEKYNEKDPNTTVDIELVKGDTLNVLKIRMQANELPDVIVGQADWIYTLGDTLEPLNDLECVKDNIYAADLAIDGNSYAVPYESFYNCTFYRKDIFAKYNIEVPKTWQQFVDAVKLIADKGEYIPLAVGGKDEWPLYPYGIDSTIIEAGNAQILNEMATMEDPFAPGKPAYNAYSKLKELSDLKAFGEDPLGIGFDDSKTFLGTSNRAVMFPSSQWAVGDVATANGGTLDNIGVMFIPHREKESDPLYTVSEIGMPFMVTKSENSAVAKDFVNWLFSDEIYTAYLEKVGLISTLKTVETPYAPIFKEAIDSTANLVPLAKVNNELYTDVVAGARFSFDQGCAAIMSNKDLDELMAKYNSDWAKAVQANK